MNQMMEDLQSRYAALELNERRALLGLGVFLLLTLIYLIVWSPINTYVDSSRIDHERHRELLNYLQSTSDDARSAARSGSNRSSGPNLISTVSGSARAVGVSPSRMQPEGADAVSVWFEAVPFTQLMLWLERLDKESGVAVRQISIENQDAPGQVSARLVLRR